MRFVTESAARALHTLYFADDRYHARPVYRFGRKDTELRTISVQLLALLSKEASNQITILLRTDRPLT